MSLAEHRSAGPQLTTGAPVGLVLVRWLEQQRDALVEADRQTRDGDKHGVHDLRVSLRKLRSALATFRPFVDRSVTEPLRDELRWAGGELGGARDHEVVDERLHALLLAERERLLVGPVRPEGPDVSAVSVLDETAEEDRPSEAAVVADTLDSERYARLLVALDVLVAQPPLTPRAEEPARKQATKRVHRDLARLLARAEHTTAEMDEPARVESLHEVRKAAKRLRYAAEAARPVTGKRVRRVGKTAKQLQKVLGEHHDTWMTREVLASNAARSDERGDSSFTIGRLHGLEQARAEHLERRAQVVLTTLTNLADRDG
ncbi:hypothetical protein BA895_22085 [Humibacillus sp. DSM 29435]|uniref:CHAD domain-containing protein n=1 Tax=Humibacillus sp. DSM 29435 TaxID=1869167 RepID=UPI000871DA13|nr:CHAD domain-containing protein [Humibacillus sp. DSM 29435]OFE15655.1 hypothetical protein BA895_22085 [Humibacillus sp. DSM 29435]